MLCKIEGGRGTAKGHQYLQKSLRGLMKGGIWQALVISEICTATMLDFELGSFCAELLNEGKLETLSWVCVYKKMHDLYGAKAVLRMWQW